MDQTVRRRLAARAVRGDLNRQRGPARPGVQVHPGDQVRPEGLGVQPRWRMMLGRAEFRGLGSEARSGDVLFGRTVYLLPCLDGCRCVRAGQVCKSIDGVDAVVLGLRTLWDHGRSTRRRGATLVVDVVPHANQLRAGLGAEQVVHNLDELLDARHREAEVAGDVLVAHAVKHPAGDLAELLGG